MQNQNIKTIAQLGQTISAAESFTGGMFAKIITEQPGASKYFKGSIVCYQNDVKINVLKINPKTIETYGVVSQQVATEMAICSAKLFNSTYGFGFTGNAGPDSSDGSMVGLVYLAIYNSLNGKTKELELLLDDEDRIGVQKTSVNIALNAIAEVM